MRWGPTPESVACRTALDGGNARLSPRSMAYTAVFTAAGFASATLFDTSAALGILPLSAVAHTVTPSAAALAAWGLVAALAVNAFGALALLHWVVERLLLRAVAADDVATAGGGGGGGGGVDGDEDEEVVGSALNKRQESSPQGLSVASRRLQQLTRVRRAVDVLSEALAGFVFGAGLIVSGMIHPVKVGGFLSVLSPAWDPSLALVLGAALALAAPGRGYRDEEIIECRVC